MSKNSVNQNIRIILTITSKDILDALKNKTTLSILASAVFLFVFYAMLPIFEQDKVIDVFDAGSSTWLPNLEDSQPYRIRVYSAQEEMEQRISRNGASELGLVLPPDFDQQVAAGSPVVLQGFLLNWVSEKQTAVLLDHAEAQVSGVVGVSVKIIVERLYLLPESTGDGLNRGLGSLLLVMMAGMVLVPNLMFEEKRTRTLDALLVSPASAGQIATGKALAGLFFCLLGFSMACLYNRVLIMQWGLAILAGICMILFTVSLGLFLGMLAKNRQQLMLWANVSIFPLLIAIFISIETEVLPGWLTAICRWLPSTAAFDLLRASFTPQISFAFIGIRLIDVLFFSIALLCIVAWRIRRTDRM